MSDFDPTVPDKKAHRIILDKEDDDHEFLIFLVGFILGIIIGAIIV